MMNQDMVHNIDESATDWEIGSTRIRLENGRKSEVDPAKLARKLKDDVRSPLVTELAVDESSRLPSLDFCDAFPSLSLIALQSPAVAEVDALVRLPALEVLYVTPRKSVLGIIDIIHQLHLKRLSIQIGELADLQRLVARMNRLETLGIIGFKESGSNLAIDKIDLWFQLIGAKCDRLALNMTVLRAGFYYCSKLVSITGVNAGIMNFDTCKNFDWNCLRAMPDLRCLIIRNGGILESLDFAATSPTIRRLTITATTIKCDIMSLAASQALKSVFIANRREHSIRELASARPDICVSNGKVWLYQNRDIPSEEWFKYSNEFQPD